MLRLIEKWMFCHKLIRELSFLRGGGRLSVRGTRIFLASLRGDLFNTERGDQNFFYFVRGGHQNFFLYCKGEQSKIGYSSSQIDAPLLVENDTSQNRQGYQGYSYTGNLDTNTMYYLKSPEKLPDQDKDMEKQASPPPSYDSSPKVKKILTFSKP